MAADQVMIFSGHLISQGNTQIYEVIKEAGLNMGLLSGDSADDKKEDAKEDDKEGASSSKPSSSGPGVVETIQQQGAQVC